MSMDASASPGAGRARGGAAAVSAEDVVRRAFAANNGGDLDGFLAWLAPDVEWLSAGLFLFPAQLWKGRENVREGLTRGIQERGGLEYVTLRELRTVADELLVLATVSTAGARRPVTLPIAWRMTVREGRITRVHGYVTEQQACSEWSRHTSSTR